MMRRFFTLTFILMIALCLHTEGAVAQSVLEPANTCTDGPQFRERQQNTPQGILSSVYQNVQVISLSITQTMFTTIQGSSDFTDAVKGIITLYIGLYGMFYAVGIARVSTTEFISHIIKIGIIALIADPQAWNLFRNTVMAFFNNGTDEILTELTSLAVGATNTPVGGDTRMPLGQIDRALSLVFSSNMAVHLLAMLFTPPYGLLYLVLIAIALWAFIGMLLTAAWVYLSATVLRALLFGVAPIFLVCMLFNKTRDYFIGWINQVIATCLQPILLFTFFTFFALMATKYVNEIVTVPVCWTEATHALQGTPFNMHFWRYTVPSNAMASGFEPYGGRWGWNGPIDVSPGSASTFPIPFMTILMFLAISELGRRFTQVVLMIARDISSTSVDLSGMQNALSDLAPKDQASQSQMNAMNKSMQKGTVGQDIKDKLSGMVSNVVGASKTNKK